MIVRQMLSDVNNVPSTNSKNMINDGTNSDSNIEKHLKSLNNKTHQKVRDSGNFVSGKDATDMQDIVEIVSSNVQYSQQPQATVIEKVVDQVEVNLHKQNDTEMKNAS